MGDHPDDYSGRIIEGGLPQEVATDSCAECSIGFGAHKRTCSRWVYETTSERRPPLTHVALRFRDQIWSLPRPYRHHHIIRTIIRLDPDVDSVDCDIDDQGFLDASGRYLTRKQAEVNARAHGQIKNGKIIGGVLTSEDLW
jgi:hypothetical protein